MAIPVDRKLKWWQQIYVIELVRGLWVTTTHFGHNMLGHVLGLFGVSYRKTETVTIQYPEKQPVIPERYHTRHRLTRNPDGSPRCVACMCCESICPADCIYIVAGEYPDRRIEKYPVRFEIDFAKCVWCGLCVEACPEDAIRMDTCIIETAEYDRSHLYYDKEFLLEGVGKNEGEVDKKDERCG